MTPHNLVVPRHIRCLMVAAALAWTGVLHAATFDVQASGTSFNPANLTIQVGDSVRWVVGVGSHTTTSNDGLWNSPLNGVTPTFTHTFTAAGSFSYFCQPHVSFGMTGVVNVTTPDVDPPVVALTSAVISGTVSDTAATLTSFTVNGTPVAITGQTFSHEQAMATTTETVTIVAQDAAANSETRTVVITTN